MRTRTWPSLYYTRLLRKWRAVGRGLSLLVFIERLQVFFYRYREARPFQKRREMTVIILASPSADLEAFPASPAHTMPYTAVQQHQAGLPLTRMNVYEVYRKSESPITHANLRSIFALNLSIAVHQVVYIVVDPAVSLNILTEPNLINHSSTNV